MAWNNDSVILDGLSHVSLQSWGRQKRNGIFCICVVQILVAFGVLCRLVTEKHKASLCLAASQSCIDFTYINQGNNCKGSCKILLTACE